MKWILKISIEMIWIVIRSKINTRHVQVKQLKIKKVKSQVQKNQNHNIIFNDSLQDHNIDFFFILTGLKTTSLQWSLIFSMGYNLNVF